MNTPRFIYFTGVDGSGKSTIIEEIIKELTLKGVKAKSVWLRFNYFFTRPVLFLCRMTGLTRREKRGDKIISVHDFHKSRTIASMVQYLHFIDTVIAYVFKVWVPLKFSDHIIFCDKFVYDILADFMVETKDLDLLDKYISKLFIKLIPENSPVFFISADKDAIIRRKPEVLIDDEDYDLKYAAYQKIMKSFKFNTIRNEKLEQSVSAVRNIIAL
jgi:thymidylate kinase